MPNFPLFTFSAALSLRLNIHCFAEPALGARDLVEKLSWFVGDEKSVLQIYRS